MDVIWGSLSRVKVVQTNSTPAAPARAPAMPIFLCGAAAPVLCTVALEVALELELNIELELALALPPPVTTSTLVPARELATPNSLGIVVLNSAVTVGTGANAVVDGVLDATTLVSGC